MVPPVYGNGRPPSPEYNHVQGFTNTFQYVYVIPTSISIIHSLYDTDYGGKRCKGQEIVEATRYLTSADTRLFRSPQTSQIRTCSFISRRRHIISNVALRKPFLAYGTSGQICFFITHSSVSRGERMALARILGGSSWWPKAAV